MYTTHSSGGGVTMPMGTLQNWMILGFGYSESIKENDTLVS